MYTAKLHVTVFEWSQSEGASATGKLSNAELKGCILLIGSLLAGDNQGVVLVFLLLLVALLHNPGHVHEQGLGIKGKSH